MSSVYLKISSLVIRTLSKPIANRIKAQAREHERFRKICVNFAQGLHRVDMRLRLGLLQDQAAIDRQIAKEAADAKAKAAKAAESKNVPTAKTKAQAKAEEAAADKAKAEKDDPPKKAPTPRIRPLTEAKAIDLGANFISEGFLFGVGLGLIVFETWRSRRKENKRRDDVAVRIAELETREVVLTEKLQSMDEEMRELRRGKTWFGALVRGKEDSRVDVREEVERKVRERMELEEKEEKEAEETQRNARTISSGSLQSVTTDKGKAPAAAVSPASPLARGETRS